MVLRLTRADMRTAAGVSGWQRWQLPDAAGSCYTDLLTLEPGLTLAMCHYQPQHDLLEEGGDERSGQSLTIALALEGDAHTRDSEDRCFRFRAGHTTVAAFHAVSGERYFSARQPVRQLRLIVDEARLTRYNLPGLLGGFQASKQHQPLFSGVSGAAVRQMAENLIGLHQQGGNLLDIQIAALSLLAAQNRQLSLAPQRAGKISSDLEDKVLRARDLLQQHYHRPLTLAWLCVTVGTNECSLKQGFRTLFGTSVYRMLTDIRMRRAWELLEEGTQVSVVGWRVGFSHLSSFSDAFQRYWGRTPKSVRPARDKQ